METQTGLSIARGRGLRHELCTELRSCDRGSVIMQFVIVLPFLLLFFIGIIDVSRYMAVQSVLIKGAEDGLNVAMKVPNLDLDLRGVPEDSYEYTMYKEARRRVLDAAMALPSATLVSDAGAGTNWGKFVEFDMTDPVTTAGGETELKVAKNALLLRPGEEAESEGHTVDHLTLKYSPDRQSWQTPQALMEKYPIMIRLQAKVDMITPFIPDITATGTALGYRENVPSAHFGVVTDEATGSQVTITTTTTTTTTTLYEDTTTTTLPLSCLPDWKSYVSISRCINPNSADAFGVCLSQPCTDLDQRAGM